jgi:hypothetical protein
MLQSLTGSLESTLACITLCFQLAKPDMLVAFRGRSYL